MSRTRRPARATTLGITAEPDENVSPAAVHRMHDALDATFGGAAVHERFVLRGSGHVTLAPHWDSAMRETIAWLTVHA